MRTWLVAVGACVGLMAAVQAGSAQAVWRTAATANYRVVSQLSDRETTAWMRSFDQFILSTSEVLRMNLHAVPPLTVVIFANDKDYEPYKLLRPNGRTANVAGQFARRPSWSVIGMAYSADDAQLRMTLQHEATHWLMSADPSPQPAWFSEGIAEMFSTFESGVGTVSWAKPIGDHLALLHARGTMPLGPFLAEPSALFDRDDRQEQFYAQAWAFTHFLMLSNGGARRPQLTEFLKVFRTKSGDETVKEVFGTDLTALEKEFAIYIDQRGFPYIKSPAKAAAAPPALEAATPALVQASLGFLALGAGRSELARQHAEKAIAIDDNEPGGHAILAYLDMDGGDPGKAAIQAEAALARGSKDSDLFLLAAYSYINGDNADKPNAGITGVDLYEQSINLNPRREEAFDQLAGALVNLDKPRPEDVKFMDLGLQVFPTDDWLQVGKAVVERRLGQGDAATSALDDMLRPGSHLNDAQRSFATNLRQQWLIEAMNAELRAAADKRDPAAVQAVITRYRSALSGDARAQEFLDEVANKLKAGGTRPR